MKPINKDALIRNVVITLLSLLLTWICLCPPSCNKPKSSADDVQNSFLLNAEHVQLVSSYQRQMTVFKTRNDSLQKELIITKQKLLVYQNDALRNKTIVQKRISKQSRDTLSKLADCDSLKQEVNNYIQSVQSQDSLQQGTIAQLETIVADKDSALSVCQQHFESMSNLADFSIKEQSKLEQDLQKANRKIKHRAILTRVFAGTTIVLAAVTTALLIH